MLLDGHRRCLVLMNIGRYGLVGLELRDRVGVRVPQRGSRARRIESVRMGFAIQLRTDVRGSSHQQYTLGRALFGGDAEAGAD